MSCAVFQSATPESYAMVPVRACWKSACDSAVMSAALRKPRAYSASMTENVKLTCGGSLPLAGGGAVAALAIWSSSLIVVIAWTSQACAAGSPGNTSGATAATAAPDRAPLPNVKGSRSWTACRIGSYGARSKVAGVPAVGSVASVVTVETVKNCCTARTKARVRVATYPACCAAWPDDTPGATGWVNGGSHGGLPGSAKKPVHWGAVTCLSVATVGSGVAGDVVPGSHRAIWSASALGRQAKEMSEPGGTSAVTLGLSVTASPVTSDTVLPAARPAPNADMPTLTEPVPPEPPKVSMAVPGGQSLVVVAARLGSGSPPASAKVTFDCCGTPWVPMAFALRAMVVAVTASTVVPDGRPSATAVMPALIPVAAAKVSRLAPAGQSAVVWTVTAGSAEPGAMTKATGAPWATVAVTPVLSMTPVAVVLSTVVPGAMPVPRTVMPLLMPIVSARARAVPDAHSAVVDVVTGGIEALNTSSVAFEIVPVRGGLSVTVAPSASTFVTVVPGSTPGPLTGMPAPIPDPAANVSAEPEPSAGIAPNGGMTNPWVSASRSRSR